MVAHELMFVQKAKPSCEIADLTNGTATPRPTAIRSGHPSSCLVESYGSNLVRSQRDKFSLEMLIALEAKIEREGLVKSAG